MEITVREKLFRFFFIISIMVMMLSVVTACSPADEGASSTGEVSVSRKPGVPISEQPEAAPEEAAVDTTRLYIVQLLNTKREKIFLRNLYTGREYVYRYSLMTDFLDKYGGDASVTSFGPGRVVTITESGSDRTLDIVQAADEVWTYDDIVNYSIDEDRGVMKIGETNYRLTSDTMVFSGDVEADYDDIGEDDVLSVIGLDKDILTITITTGHGYLTVINTEKFEGSLLCVGTTIYAKVVPDMTLTVPEGKYRVTAANKGYGGTKKVKIKRNETTVLDLKELEGEGPKYCKLTVKSSVEGASIMLDGNEIKEGKKTKVPYGRHTLTIRVEGYDTWTRTLFVNSETAEITVDPTASEETEEKEEDEDTGDEDEKEDEGTAGHRDRDDDGDYDEDDAEVDYLSTVNDMISNLAGLSDND